jgi:hypothetical protein
MVNIWKNDRLDAQLVHAIDGELVLAIVAKLVQAIVAELVCRQYGKN